MSRRRFLTQLPFALLALTLGAPLAAQHALTPATALRSAHTPTSRGESGGESWQLTVTVFRNPGTGLELRRGAFMVFAGHYPTIIRRDDWRGDDRPTTHFLRFGAGLALRPQSMTSPYASVSFANSRSEEWSDSWILDGGVRQRLGRNGWAHRATGRLGVGWLRSSERSATRVNPTVGLGWDL